MAENGPEGFRLASGTPVRRSATETVHATCVVIDEGGVRRLGARFVVRLPVRGHHG